MFKLSSFFPYMSEAGEGDETGGGDTLLTDPPAETPAETTEGTQEDKPSEDKPADDKPVEEDKEPEIKAPEKYEFKMPEGVELDQGMLDKVEPIFRELDLSNEQASKLTEAYAAQVQEANDQMINNWNQQQTQWAEDLKKDPEFGGANFDTNVEVAKEAIARFGDDDLKQALNETGMGNHPAFVKLFNRIGKSISEDAFSSGEDDSQGSPSLYPNSNMNR